MKYAEGSVTPLLVSRKEAARLLNLSVKSVDLLLKDNRLMPTFIGGRKLISMATLSAFAAAGCSSRIREDYRQLRNGAISGLASTAVQRRRCAGLDNQV